MRLTLALVLLGLVSFFFGLGSVGLIGPDESRYAQVARAMLERADWITPHLQGEPWLDKPPLYYWAAAGSMRLLGETETAARLPAAVAALATCFAIACVGTRWFGFAAGLRSALVLASSLASVNMTSGDILANMYQLTVEQLLLSAALGAAVGLTIDAQVRLSKACAPGAVGGSAAAAGSGLAATVAASSTGILGCCGSGLAGGVLALAGITGGTAAQIAEYSHFVQLALIALFALAYVRFARRLKALAGTT